MPRRRREAVVRRGIRHVGRAIALQPRIFAAALLGSTLFAVMTVASAYVIGEITERVVLPSFDEGSAATGALALAVVAIIGVALLRIVGIIGRRLLSGIMQYRLQAQMRREVTAQYLRLPLSWHQQHPTGQLLSNANSDVEAAWFFVAPLAFGLGAVVIILITGGAMVATDPLLALIGLVVFPLVFVINALYSQVMSPRQQRAQQLRAEVSEIAHESFDAALVVKTLGREQSETERFDARAGELRDGLIAVGRVRGLFDPLIESLPNLGTLAVLLVGAHRVADGAIDVGELVSIAYLFTLLALPIRAIGWVLAELPRALAGYDRITPVLEATGETPYGPDDVAAPVEMLLDPEVGIVSLGGRAGILAGAQQLGVAAGALECLQPQTRPELQRTENRMIPPAQPHAILVDQDRPCIDHRTHIPQSGMANGVIVTPFVIVELFPQGALLEQYSV